MGKDPKTMQWGRTNTHGGGMLENHIQATSNDLLRDWIHSCQDDGMDVVLHVHDEVVVECDIDDAQKVYDRMGELMPGQVSHYCDTWNIDSDGGIHPRFTKD
jgi:DNA polymerase